MKEAITQRQFFKTAQTAAQIEAAIRESFIGIKNLKVFLDKSQPATKQLTVSFQEGTADPETIAKFLETLPPYIK